MTAKQSILSLLAVLLIAAQFLSAIHGYEHLDPHAHDHAHPIVTIYDLNKLDEFRQHLHQHQHQHQHNEDDEICEICLALSGLSSLFNATAYVSFSELSNTQTQSLSFRIIANTAYIIPPVRGPPFLVMS